MERRGNRLLLAGGELFRGDTSQLLETLAHLATNNTTDLVVTPNSDQTLNLVDDAEYRRVYNDATLRLVDGMPLIYLARALGDHHVQRHTGADLLPLVVGESVKRGWRTLVAGGAPGVAQRSVLELTRQFPGADVSSIPFPTLSGVDDPASRMILEHIGAAKPTFVFLCLGSPKQELWFDEWRSGLPPAVYIGAGASVDFAAGLKRRAPMWIQTSGLEWAYRLSQEPTRLWRRYLVKGPRFAGVAARSVAVMYQRRSQS